MLVITGDDREAHELGGRLYERTQNVSWSRVHTVDQARRELANGWFDAVLLRPGPKALSFRAFATFVDSLPKRPKLLVIGSELPGAARLEDGEAARIVDQVLAVLGLTRSAIHDHEVVEELDVRSPFELHLVRAPGSAAVLVRGSSSIELGDAERALAQRAAAVRGPGLPDVIEAWWDDPKPHAFYAVPRGVSLNRVRAARRTVDRDTALAVLHGVAIGVATMHAAGMSVGELGVGRVWLGAHGEVLLPGNGFAQLTPTRSRFLPMVPGSDPPEEGSGTPRSIGGDAFRVGVLLHVLVAGVQPFAKVDTFSFMQGAWPPLSDRVREVLGDAVALLEMTLRSSDTERPRGELLREQIARYAPKNREDIVRGLVRLASS